MKILWLGWQEFYTTRRMQEAARERGVDLEAREIFDLCFQAADGRAGLFAASPAEGTAGNLVESCDALVVRTFHPYISEALTIARLFRDAGKTVVDESLTDEGYVVSKMHDYLLLARHGVPIPRTWQVYDPAEVEARADRLGYPCILKGVHGAAGNHVHRVEDAEQLRRRLWRYPCGELALQEFLPAEEDYRVLTVGYQALPLLAVRRPPAGDFRTNFAAGAEFSACPLAEKPGLRELAERAARVLRREFAGVDIRYKGDTPLVLEVNRRPDFEGFELATQLDVAGAFLAYIKARVGD